MALKTDLTSGRVPAQLLRFALPVIVSNLLQAMYNAVDMLVVGHFGGTAALSAVAVCGPVMNIVIMAVEGLSIGVSIVVGGHLGAGAPEKAIRDCAGTAVSLYLIIAAVVSAAGWALAPGIISLIQTPADAYAGAVGYLRIIFAGIIFMFGYNLISALSRGFGDSKTALYFVAGATLVNVVLDLVFVGPMDMGPRGAALATVIAQASSVFMGAAYFRKKKHVATFNIRGLRIDRVQLRLILRAGLPAAIQSFLINVSSATVTGIANSIGLTASAAYGIAMKAESFGVLPSDALSHAMSAFAAQNVAAGKPERALHGLKSSLLIAGACMAVMMTAFIAFAPQIAHIFDKDPAVIQTAAGYMRISCVVFMLYGIVMPLIGFVRGTGSGVFTIISVLLTQYVIKIPLSYVLVRVVGFNGIAVSEIIAFILASVFYGAVVYTGRWRTSKEVKRSNGPRGSAAKSTAAAGGLELSGGD